jgi:hypothetical protein
MTAGLTKLDIDPAALDPNGIAESQTVTATNSLALDGALCDLGTAGQFDIGDAYSSGVGGVKLLFDAAGDINTAVFTITGKDQDGVSITETVTGVTTTAVSTDKYYSQVTEIAVTIATATDVFVGTVTGELVTKSIPINRYAQHPAACAVSALAGTCQFDLQETYDNLEADGTENAAWFDFSSDASTDIAATATANATGVRLKFDSYTDGAELQFHVSYNPFR